MYMLGTGTFDLEVTETSTGNVKTLIQGSTANMKPVGWTPDGRGLVVIQTVDKSVERAIWTIPVDDPGNASQYRRDGGQVLEARLSPDGKWIVYATDLSGRFEVEVRSFPVPGAKHPISLEGGGYPRWRADGRKLYFVSPNSQIMAVGVTDGKSRVQPTGATLRSENWSRIRTGGTSPRTSTTSMPNVLFSRQSSGLGTVDEYDDHCRLDTPTLRQCPESRPFAGTSKPSTSWVFRRAHVGSITSGDILRHRTRLHDRNQHPRRVRHSECGDTRGGSRHRRGGRHRQCAVAACGSNHLRTLDVWTTPGESG